MKKTIAVRTQDAPVRVDAHSQARRFMDAAVRKLFGRDVLITAGPPPSRTDMGKRFVGDPVPLDYRTMPDEELAMTLARGGLIDEEARALITEINRRFAHNPGTWRTTRAGISSNTLPPAKTGEDYTPIPAGVSKAPLRNQDDGFYTPPHSATPLRNRAADAERVASGLASTRAYADALLKTPGGAVTQS